MLKQTPIDEHNWPYIHGAEMALHDLGPGKADPAVPRLIELLQDWHIDIHLGAFDALTAIAPQTPEIYACADWLVSDMAHELRERAAPAMVFNSHRPDIALAGPALRKMLLDPYREVRTAAITCLTGSYPAAAKVDADWLLVLARNEKANVKKSEEIETATAPTTNSTCPSLLAALMNPLSPLTKRIERQDAKNAKVGGKRKDADQSDMSWRFLPWHSRHLGVHLFFISTAACIDASQDPCNSGRGRKHPPPRGISPRATSVHP